MNHGFQATEQLSKECLISEEKGTNVYQDDAKVEGICTRGLLHHGTQVSLVRKDLFTGIKRCYIEQCHSRNGCSTNWRKEYQPLSN